MHNVYSKAKRTAWRGEQSGQQAGYLRFVPYANQHSHSHSRSNSKDVERDGGPLDHTQSSPITSKEHQAVGLGRSTDTPNGPPNRSSTEPASRSAPIPEESASIDQHIVSDSPKRQTGSSGTLTNGSSSEEQDLRKRNTRPGTEDEKGPPPLPKADTSQSKQSKKDFRKRHYPIGQQLKVVFWTWPNLLLVCVPIGIALYEVNVNPLAVFIVNFLAIVPLAGILSMATEEIALYVGETLGGLLNASFGNATELIVAIIALAKDEIVIVQTSLIGSMLSNLLLVMGMCFLFGGWNRKEQYFNVTVAQTASSLLALAAGSLIIPTVFVQWSQSENEAALQVAPELSRGTSVILLFVYGCYLLFQLKTHTSMYNETGGKAEKRHEPKDFKKSIAAVGQTTAGPEGRLQAMDDSEAPEEEEVPQLSATGAIITLCGATALIGVCSEFLVSSINYVTTHNGVSQEFVGLILLPIVGNAAEHATAVTVAIKDKMDLAIGVAVGSSMQIALLVLPLAVVIGWIIGAVEGASYEPMTLNFDGFVIAVLFVSVLLVNYLIGDGKSHWLEGIMLMTTYIIIAVAAWFYPSTGQQVAG